MIHQVLNSCGAHHFGSCFICFCFFRFCQLISLHLIVKRVRKAAKADCPNFSQKSEMKCLLRTGDPSSETWALIDSIPIAYSPSSGQELAYRSNSALKSNQQSNLVLNSSSSRRIAELYFTPILSINTPLHSPTVRKRSTTVPSISPIRSKRIESSTSPTEMTRNLNITVRSSSPDPTAQYSSSRRSNNLSSPTQRRSVTRSRLSSPDHRLRAASFFAVSSSPSSLIEETNQCPFSIPVCDILSVELVSTSSSTVIQSSAEHALILITLNSKELYEITFYKTDALDILYAFLCAMVPSGRRKVRVEEAKMIDDEIDEPIVHDIANFEAHAVEDYFRNETYLERMSRRSQRLLQRLCDCTFFFKNSILFSA